MAGDWIKLEHVTPDKPEVHRMAELLGIDPDAVVGKLVRVWIWADQQTTDGHAPSVTRALLDRLTAVTGFADAMAHDTVRWLIRDDTGEVSFPHFDRHNGASAKARSCAAKRQQTHRELSRSCHAGSVTPALPEKRREEKSREEETHTSRAHEEPPQPTPDQTGPATQLLSLLQSTGAWNHRDHGITALAELGRLIEARGERETLEEAQWYAEHHGDRYAPSICGIRDLDKWPKIRAAMARHAQESRLADNGLSLLDEADRLEREREAKK
jgi:hypothetical protein